MMNGPEKSDSAIVAVKPANKAGTPAAEWGERRAGTKGNTGQPHTRRTQSRGSVLQGLDCVRNAAKQRKKEKFTALLHHVTVDLLRESFLALKRRATPGVDGVTWEDYGVELETNLQDLHARVHSGGYRALLVRRRFIPKPGTDKRRPLGMPRWKTRSSSERSSRCSTPSTRKSSSGSRMGSGPDGASTMRLMHCRWRSAALR